MAERTREDVIRIAQKLKDMTFERGATPAEAEFAALRLQKLLKEYQLSIFDIEKPGTYNEKLTRVDHVLKDFVEPPPRIWVLANQIAKAYDCNLIMDKHFDYENEDAPVRAKFVFLGHETDVEIARYFFVYLSYELAKMAKTEHQRIHSQERFSTFKNSFVIAAAHQIYNRLVAQRNQDMGVNTQESKKMYALVEVKGKQLEEFTKREFPKLVRKKSNHQTSYTGHQLGARAGKEISLTKGLSHTKNNGVLGSQKKLPL